MTASAQLSTLPALTAAEAEHSRALLELLRGRIRDAHGFVDFETFMELALYAPGLGYYSAGSAKLGAAGDFVTAPEISPLFGECVAQQCVPILEETAGEILEIGAGSGRLAAVLLQRLDALGRLPRRYAILEVSADLKARQREHLEALPPRIRQRVSWLERLPQQPLAGVMLANEVLDALPVQRLVLRADGPRVRGVGLGADGALIEQERPAPAEVRARLAAVLGALPEPLPEDYECELSLRLGPWLASLAACLQRGVMLLFDYGLPRAHYYHPERRYGTLRCHFRHRAHDDPLRCVGVQDITAWVDFTAVAEAADAGGLEVLGFATQAAFLLGNGLAERAASGDGIERLRRASEAHRLLMPGEMGEAFKVMALGRDWRAPLAGFAHQDLRGSL